MKLLVAILNYRDTGVTIDCLRSLESRIGRVPGTRVAVLENGTGGDAAERLRRAVDENGWERWVDLEVSPTNLGFTGGNNRIIRQALASSSAPEYVLLLNSDTLVHDRSLEALVEFMDRHPRAGIAGSMLVWPGGGVQGSPFRFLGIGTEMDSAVKLGVLTGIFRPASISPKPTAACAVDWVSGASMMLRRTMLDEIGLLDEGLFTYFEDVDLCLRAARTGWSSWYVPESVVTHLEGRSSGIVSHVRKRRPDYWFQARRRYFLKNHGPAYTALADAGFILGYLTWMVRRRIQRRPDTDIPMFLRDFVRNSVYATGFRVRRVTVAESGNGAPKSGRGPRPSTQA